MTPNTTEESTQSTTFEPTVGGVKPKSRSKKYKIKIKKTKTKMKTKMKTKTQTSSSSTTSHKTKPSNKVDYVFTDGSTFNNGKYNAVGGIGIFFNNNDKRNLSEPFLLKPITNNRCEIFAVIKAIENYASSLPPPSKTKTTPKRQLTIYCDSMYTIDLITKWIHRWKQNGWKTSTGKDVKNKDLIVWLDSLITVNKHNFQISFEHSKAHRREPKDKSSYSHFLWYGNMMADKFATSASKVASKAFRTSTRAGIAKRLR